MEQKVSRIKYVLPAILSALVLIGIDQLTKYLAVIHLKEKESFVILENVFSLQYLENRGAAFGILQGKKVFFLILSIVLLIVLGYCYVRMIGEKRFRPMRILVIFLFAGAIGNMIDRVWHDYVIDFFYFELIDFPIFNVADIYITVSCIVFIILFLFYYKEEDFERIFPRKKKEVV